MRPGAPWSRRRNGARGARSRTGSRGHSPGAGCGHSLCRRARWRARSSGARAEPLLDHVHHLLDAMAQRVLLERALARVLPDGPRLVEMGEVVPQVVLELFEVAIGEDLLSRLEQRGQLLLQIHHLTGPRRGQLESARVDADDVVEGMVMIEGEYGATVDGELGPPPHRSSRHRGADLGRLRP